MFLGRRHFCVWWAAAIMHLDKLLTSPSFARVVINKKELREWRPNFWRLLKVWITHSCGIILAKFVYGIFTNKWFVVLLIENKKPLLSGFTLQYMQVCLSWWKFHVCRTKMFDVSFKPEQAAATAGAVRGLRQVYRFGREWSDSLHFDPIKK